MNDGTYRITPAGFVVRATVNGDKIVGRISGYGPGTWWYQIAARPYDEPSATGFEHQAAAFLAMCQELHRRANQDTIAEARAS